MEEPPWSCNSEGVLLCLLSFAAAVKPLANVIGNHICSDSHKKIDEDVAHMTHLLSVARLEKGSVGILAYMVKFEKPPNGGFFHGLMSFGTCGIGF